MSSNIIPFSRFRADVARSGSARVRELLSMPDPEAALAALDPVDLFSVVQEVGESDSMDLLAFASAEQVRRVIDLAGFSSLSFSTGAPDLIALERYFAAAVAHGPGQVSAFFGKLDEELQTLYLSRRFNVFDARDEDLPDPEDETVERYLTPDGTFVVEVKKALVEASDDRLPKAANDEQPREEQKNPEPFSALALIADLYYTDWRVADTMMRDAKWAINAELEEEVQRVRAGRLEEMGFPPIDEAMKVFSRPAPSELERRTQTAVRSSMPTLYAAPFLADSYFMRVLALVSDATLIGQIESELVFLVNAACVISSVSVAERGQLAAQAKDVSHLISLGLESHSHGEVEVATQALAAHPLRAFVAIALGHVFKLGDWARRAEAEGLFRLPTIDRRAISAEDEHFLRALLAKHPRYVERGLDASRAFASRAELQTATKRLEHMAKALLVARWLSRGLADLPTALEGAQPGANEIAAEPLSRSLLLKRALGLPLEPLAVTRAELHSFHSRFGRTGAWPSDADVWPDELNTELADLWRALLADVDDAGGDGDPRFLALVTKGN